jgi:hypothetical protein
MAVQGDGVDGINIKFVYFGNFYARCWLDGDSVLSFWMQAGKFHHDGSIFLKHDGTPLRGPLTAAASTTAAAAASAFARMAFSILNCSISTAPYCR